MAYYIGVARMSRAEEPAPMSFKIPMRPVDLPKRLPDIRNYILQCKYDGWYVVFRGGRAYTRTGEDITSWACWSGRGRGRSLPENAVGELVHLGGREKIPALAYEAADRMKVVLFDIPGPDPLEERLARLPELSFVCGFEYAYPYYCDSWEEANQWLSNIRNPTQVEGYVLKRRGSPWVAGDSKHWYRFKKPVAVEMSSACSVG